MEDIGKRMYSKAYHDEEKRWLDRDLPSEQTQEKGCAFATDQVARFIKDIQKN